MKLIFTKDTQQNVTIQIVTGTTTVNFSYTNMLKELLKNNDVEESVYSGDFSDEEKDKINDMMNQIQQTIRDEVNVED